MPTSSIALVVGFKAPQYYTGKESYVSYYIVNPADIQKGLQRKKIKLNHIQDPAERRKYARVLCQQLLLKLAHGWNPFLEQEAPRAFTMLSEALDTFLAAKTKELRHNSIRTYTTLVKGILEYLSQKNRSNEYCINFTHTDAMDLMRIHSDSEAISSRTFNNKLQGYRILFNWLIDQQYIKANPFAGIKKMIVQGKTRIIIPPDWMARALDWLSRNHPPALFAARHVYHMLIRPEEITKLKPEYYNLHTQTLLIPASIAKNKKDNTVTIPDHMVPIIREYFIMQSVLPNQYIFGKDLLPGNKPINARRMGKVWNRMRKAIGMPAQMQFYSLKDTGIVNLLQIGVSIDSVKNQARHSNVSETSAYLPYAKNSADPAILGLHSTF